MLYQLLCEKHGPFGSFLDEVVGYSFVKVKGFEGQGGVGRFGTAKGSYNTVIELSGDEVGLGSIVLPLLREVGSQHDFRSKN